MNNPFLSYLKEEKIEYLTPTCSLNKAVLAKLPIYGIDDSIEGKTFKEIFSTKLIVEEIKSIAKQHSVDISGFDDYMLPKLLDKALISDDVKYNTFALRIAKKFGDRLGLILLSLKQGSKENRKSRSDWSDEHWDYWAQLDTVIFVGGLASSMLGRHFKERIQHIFDIAAEKPYNIMLFDNGTFVGAMGCALRMMEDNSTSLVMDFGHTNLKRCIAKKASGEIREFTALESVESKYVHTKLNEGEDIWNTALLLHKHLVKTIVDTYRKNYEKYNLNNKIIISIANYNAAGELCSERGGYAKLTELGNDYAKILTEDLSGALHKRVEVKLIHDGTANALYFSEIENSACISLGTAFGVGFTDIKI
ncbi:MAG: hypothetical protein IKB73_04910 [Ruminococcus sp.]|nr:hypothetical protein [Ruminococcus sp.]